MLKKLLIATGLGALLYGLYRGYKKRHREIKPVNYQDNHHLRFIDETNLSKRLLPLESAVNMRDIGGYTNDKGEAIKWNKIYRGEELSHLTPEDQIRLEDYHIGYVFDFREEDKAEENPDDLPTGAKYTNIPVLRGIEKIEIDYSDPECVQKFMRYIYGEQVKKRAGSFAEVLKVLRDDPDAVIYVHCTNGKDRTGFMIALIMLIAGIDEEKIISDYSLTNLTFDKAIEVLGGTLADEIDKAPPQVKDFFGVDPDWLKIQLDYIRDNYGDVDNYLITNTDLTEEDLNKIRANILEEVTG